MSAHRRDFLKLVAGSVVAAVAAPAVHAQTTDRNKIRVVAFDGFPIIDPRPVFATVEEMFPGKGAELSNAWRTRQFELERACPRARRFNSGSKRSHSSPCSASR